MAYLKLENICKNFGKIKALSNINLELKDGVFCVVLGPSGCGKSTLLNIIAGLEDSSSGKLYLEDIDITEFPPEKRDMAMVFQNYALYPHLTGFENMAFSLRIKGLKKDEIQERIQRISRILNIEDKLNQYPSQLSGGQRQRLATGRAIVRNPKLFLFDEPLSNLDARLRTELRAEFIKLHQRLRKTTVYVTHDQIEASVLGELVVVIDEGRVQQISTPQELYNNPSNLFVAKFIGTPAMNIIKLKVAESNSSLFLVQGEFKFKVSGNFMQNLRNYINDTVYLGIRPSAIKIMPKADIKGKVIFVETIGEDSFARLNLAQNIEISVKINGNYKLGLQEKISVFFDPGKMYFFDNSGKRIISKTNIV